ncbi:hypothetical protein IMSHALPRED_000573 [Imshaugia aleurites]|uniref:SAP domain-containing protein n=1 Tax=Imshaugia aleurites TaxID=172621 RepID=A0A8H3GCW7_9LECA|nr:hypothetical protein IMSHALPRED_000573 [Imshaugia aleurites]
MPDYEKLTVVKLRDELVARGLPKTGLKAALVQRLIEADEPSEKAESVVNGSSESIQEDESVIKTIQPGPEPLREPKDNDHVADGAPPPGEQDKSRLQDADTADEGAPHYEADELVQTRPRTGEVQESERLEKQASDSLAEPSGYVSKLEGTQSEFLSANPNGREKEPDLQLPTPVQTQIGEAQAADDKPEVSTQTLLTGDDILEDSRKRKRRSQSPPPSSTENTQKRLKADHGRPLVELPEDSVAERTNLEKRTDVVSSRPEAPYAQELVAQTNGHTYSNEESKPAKIITSATTGQTDAEGISSSQANPSALEEMGPPKERDLGSTQVKSAESLMKPSPSETRFKNLFTAPANMEPASQQSHYPDAEDRIVGPALHPATSALYIRELMRPLKIESLRDHLIALATPPDTAVNPDIVTQFFLDSVRTHCLVGFENISAASRVRSGLHDRVWPNERDRRQLWVDFVPEEKIEKWISVEQTAGSGRGQPAKRWEVVYEDEENGIKAYLQEVGSNSGAVQSARPSRTDAGQGLLVPPPSGPRIRGSDPQSSQSRPDGGKGFRALDDLFSSTMAKPRLYYLPVSKAEADRRLAKLATGRGGGRGDEMRRFSFEEGSIVDNGPEFGRGGGYRRGGVSGSYRGRGRIYRGDAPGDSWRDRRSGY